MNRCEEMQMAVMAIADGESPPIDRAEVERHLAECTVCGRAVGDWKKVAARLGGVGLGHLDRQHSILVVRLDFFRVYGGRQRNHAAELTIAALDAMIVPAFLFALVFFLPGDPQISILDLDVEVVGLQSRQLHTHFICVFRLRYVGQRLKHRHRSAAVPPEIPIEQGIHLPAKRVERLRKAGPRNQSAYHSYLHFRHVKRPPGQVAAAAGGEQVAC